MTKILVSPETQTFSDDLMALRFAKRLKKLALVSQNKLQRSPVAWIGC
jgi:hypothetical protein